MIKRQFPNWLPKNYPSSQQRSFPSCPLLHSLRSHPFSLLSPLLPGALLGRASGTSVFLLCHITPSTIEDDTGSATYTLSPSLPPTDGYVTENATVLVEGEIGDGEEGRVGIVIKEIHHPPYANNTETRKAAGNPEQMVVVLSEVKLDRDRVVENLAKVMEGFEGMLESQMSEFSSSMEDDATVSPPPPPVFVMMGSFSSENNIHSKQGPGLYRGGWRRLEKVISQVRAGGAFKTTVNRKPTFGLV